MSADAWIILTGSLVAMSCSLVGCFLILRRMAMIGDAISHSVLPGIVIAFLISGSRDSLLMLLGAAVLGLITVLLIELFKNSGVQTDASIGVVFTTLFSIGIVLVSLYASDIDLDLDCVLYGEIGYVVFQPLEWSGMSLGPKAVWGIGGVLFISLILITSFYKQFKLCAFDPALAAAVGIPVALFHYLLMSMVSLTTVASFESVGAILVVGMLVVPPATAYLLTERLSIMIVLSMIIGIASSGIGYYLSFLWDASIAGCMITTAGAFFVMAFLFSPSHGVIIKRFKQRKEQQHLMT